MTSEGIGAETPRPLVIAVIGGALVLAVTPRLLQPALLIPAHSLAFAAFRFVNFEGAGLARRDQDWCRRVAPASMMASGAGRLSTFVMKMTIPPDPEMRWKARENLSAAKLLLGAADSHFNACVSRAYYAAYQACWSAMVVEGHPPPPSDRGAYFRHATLPKEARLAGVLDADQSDDLEWLESWRAIADYQRDLLTKEQATQACALANRLVDALVDEDG